MRIELNEANIKETLTSGPVQAELVRRAEQAADTARRLTPSRDKKSIVSGPTDKGAYVGSTSSFYHFGNGARDILPLVPRSALASKRLAFASGRTEMLPTDERHGTIAGFQRGCRCDACRDGKSAYNKAYRAANSDRIATQKLAFRLANPSTIRAWNVAWCEANKEGEAVRSAAYHAANREKVKVRNAARYIAHPEKVKANCAAYRKANPDQMRALDDRRRASEHAAYVEDVELLVLIERDGLGCSICAEPIDQTLAHPDPGSMTVDHVRPLSKGGQHSYANTALAHLRCNCRKGAYWEED